MMIPKLAHCSDRIGLACASRWLFARHAITSGPLVVLVVALSVRIPALGDGTSTIRFDSRPNFKSVPIAPHSRAKPSSIETCQCDIRPLSM